jgi:hypothetical protein
MQRSVMVGFWRAMCYCAETIEGGIRPGSIPRCTDATRNVLSVHITPRTTAANYYAIEQRVAAIPGVHAAGFTQLTPLQNWGWEATFSIRNRPTDSPLASPVQDSRRRFLCREPGLHRMPRRSGRAVESIAASRGHGGRERHDGARQFPRRALHERGEYDRVLPTRQQVLHAHGRTGRQGCRVRGQVHVRRSAASAI